jgi:4-hydroxybenzoate polyprenyltransferase
MSAVTAPILAAVKLIRPKQWIKNLFVFAPLIFAKELFQWDPLILTLRTFGAFCLTASMVYIINDMIDIEADRAHPKKRFRPLAAGTLSRTSAFFILSVLLALDVLLVTGMPQKFILLLGAYFVMNLAYTFKLKEVFLLDVFIIAAGFMLRVLGGAFRYTSRAGSSSAPSLSHSFWDLPNGGARSWPCRLREPSRSARYFSTTVWPCWIRC